VASGGAALQFDELIAGLREEAGAFPDRRMGKNTQYSITDIALSAFSVFFLQSPSFLDFQRTMGRSKGRHNAASLFGVEQVPSDNQIRSVLDAVPAESLEPMFDSVLERLHCAHCHVTHHSNGTVSYHHMLVSPAIVKAGRKEVIALAPEFIGAADGKAKAENEIVAAKRWLRRHEQQLSPLSVTIMGDDLYASQPFLEMVREAEMNFLCVCKPQSHQYLEECVESLRGTGDTETLQATEWTGKERRTTRYEWAEDVPMRSTADAMQVGWLSIEVTGEDGRRIYRNSFITNHVLNAKTVAGIAAAGRARWKIENEDINTLKTKGYNLEHNFGHGGEHLSEMLATLNILAFLLLTSPRLLAHTILDLTDRRHRLLRNTRGRRARFFTELGVVACYWYHDSWQDQMRFMVTQLELPDPGS